MSKKPRGKPQLLERNFPKHNPRHRRVVKDEFRTCGDPSGCNNIVSIQNQPSGYSGPVRCILHREEK